MGILVIRQFLFGDLQLARDKTYFVDIFMSRDVLGKAPFK
jgi:hypothetical protein